MADPKTRPTDASVDEFIAGVADETRRNDAVAITALMTKVTKQKPVMWGGAIIGFGSTAIAYANGSEMDWPLVAFSPRKANTVLYLSLDGYEKFDDIMARLGKHTSSKSCLYIKKLADVDMKVLTELVKESVKRVKAKS